MKLTVTRSLFVLLLLLCMPAVVQAQFAFANHNGAISITGYTDSDETVIIPDTISGFPVTDIASWAFFSLDRPTSITNIVIPDSVTSIGGGAFFACDSLINVNIPKGVTSIEDSTFQGCMSLKHIWLPDGVTNIGTQAFGMCYSLEDINIPGSVKTFGTSIFSSCYNITSIMIEDGVTSIAGVFQDCTSLTNIVIPSSVTNIDTAFKNCGGLQSVKIPDNVTSIGFQTFYACSGLTSVIVPTNVTSIGQDAFSECGGLTNIFIPDSVNNIAEDAFGDCFKLTSIVIPSGITHIDYGTFYGCRELAAVYFKGNAPTNIGPSVFYGATNVVVYYLPEATGWGPTFAGRPTAAWLPIAQPADASFGIQNHKFGFSVNWVSDRIIVVDACTNLSSPIWQPVQTNILIGGSFYFIDAQWTNYSGRFYRLRSP